jgi:AcrR family transcriptional regulator
LLRVRLTNQLNRPRPVQSATDLREGATMPYTDYADAPPRRTQAERRAESERNILQAAAELIAEQGVGAATLEKVGARAGYSRGLATQKYGSKQGLIEALIAHLHARLETLLQESHVEQMSGLDAVLAFANIILRELADDEEVRAYFMLMAGAVADRNAVRAAFAASHENVSQRLQKLLIHGQNDGSVLASLSPQAAAAVVGSTLLGLSTQHLVDPNMDFATLSEAAVAGLRRSLQA